MALQLRPFPQEVGLNKAFTARQSETIVLKEKILSITGDSFDIKLANGQPLFRVSGKVRTISGRKSVYDMSNHHLFDIIKEHFHLHSTYAAETPDGRKVLEVKSKIKIFGSEALATFTSHDGKTKTFKMTGKWHDFSADIIDEETGAVAAAIRREAKFLRDFGFGQQTYSVTIAPGVDMSLIAAMCICFDEKNNEQ